MSFNSWTNCSQFLSPLQYWISQDLVIKSSEQPQWHFTTFSSAAGGGLLSRFFQFYLSLIYELFDVSPI